MLLGLCSGHESVLAVGDSLATVGAPIDSPICISYHAGQERVTASLRANSDAVDAVSSRRRLVWQHLGYAEKRRHPRFFTPRPGRRAHWRCENEGHWTAYAVFDEDARRTPWTKHPDGVLVVGLMRAMAINILAVLRALCRYKCGKKWLKPTWKTVTEDALMALCDTLLDMQAFNTFED